MDKQKKLIIILISIVLLIFVVFIITTIPKKSADDDDKFSFTEEPATASEETFLEADETVGLPADNTDYPYRVTITNMGDLLDTGIITSALDYIEPYLSEYFDYYVQDGQVYEAEYIEDSFVNSYNIPRFSIYVADLDLTIDCMFIIDVKYYRFTSRFNPDGE